LFSQKNLLAVEKSRLTLVQSSALGVWRRSTAKTNSAQHVFIASAGACGLAAIHGSKTLVGFPKEQPFRRLEAPDRGENWVNSMTISWQSCVVSVNFPVRGFGK
jgi:hypothetical protein